MLTLRSLTRLVLMERLRIPKELIYWCYNRGKIDYLGHTGMGFGKVEYIGG